MRDIPFIPRFYIDHLQWLRHSGFDIERHVYDNSNSPRLNEDAVQTLLNYNPTDNVVFDYFSTLNTNLLTSGDLGFTMTSGFKKDADIAGKWFLASLGNNHASSHTKWTVKFTNNLDAETGINLTGTEVINGFGNSYDGFNIEIYDVLSGGSDDDSAFLNFGIESRDSTSMIDFGVGALSFGKVFDMPINADVELGMSYEYGTSSKETKYGSAITNIEWVSKPAWNGRPAWELYTDNQTDNVYKVDSDLPWRKSGRRVYDMSFTFLSSDDMLATSGITGDSNTMERSLFVGDATDALTDNGDDVVTNGINIKNDNSFYAQVVHKTMGFALPFIFQPNKNYAKPDGFMFAKVDEKDFSLEQLAPDLWRCKMKIREVW